MKASFSDENNIISDIQWTKCGGEKRNALNYFLLRLGTASCKVGTGLRDAILQPEIRYSETKRFLKQSLTDQHKR